jgi:ATP-dependent RNA helicase DHX8/PRP22
LLTLRYFSAEFIIHLHDQANGSLPEFKKMLKEATADFPDAFIENLDRIIKTLKPKKKVHHGDNVDDKTQKLPGLAVQDDPEWQKKRQEDMVVADDMLTELEGYKSTTATAPASSTMKNTSNHKRRQESPSPERRHHRRHRSRSRSRSPQRRRKSSRSPPRSRHGGGLDDEPVMYKIYNGTVSNIKDFGAFVRLEGIKGRAEGLVHVGSLIQGRVNNPREVVKQNQPVKVKVMSIAGNRVGLSMKDVDQRTGEDLSPNLHVRSREEMEAMTSRNPERPSYTTGSNANPIGANIDEGPSRSVKRMSSPERWELKQLIASGVVDPADYPELNEDTDFDGNVETEEEIDVEVRDEEPPFLKGQTSQNLDLSPVKVVKIPDGTMNRSALAGASLAKERRELRQQQQQQEMDAVPQDVNTPWLDPMAGPDGRQFAQDARGSAAGAKPEQVAEWKKATFNSATSFGKITSLSIQEQRESLPISKLRSSLIEAIREVSFLATIGYMPKILNQSVFLESNVDCCW